MSDQKVPWEKRKYVRVREVSEMTGISIAVIYHDIREGVLPAIKSEKITLITPADVDAWIEKRFKPAKG